ncbi:MAG: glycosyltransferase family 4 protein [Rhodothermales bacterium]
MRDSMTLLFVNQHYYPDVAATGQKLTDLAEYLAARGHAVHILCSRGKYLAGALDAPARETRNGVHIRRTGRTSHGRSTHLRRLLDYAGFYARVLLHLLFGRRYDRVILLTTPPLLGVAGGLARRLRGQEYAIWSMDLHPDAEEALGMAPAGHPVTRLLHALNDFGYRNAAFVAALGPFMRARILARGVAPERVAILPMWDRKEAIYPVPPDENPLFDRFDLRDRCVVMYSGNAGLAHRFDEVLEAMLALRDHPDLYFLFAGDGPRKQDIIAFAERHRIRNFSYVDYVPREALVYSLNLADVHLLTLRREMAGIAVPCKLYGSMAAGKPTLMVGPEASEPAQAILDAGAGIVIDPDRAGGRTVDELIQALLALAERNDLRTAYGLRGREAFLAAFEMDVVCEAWARCLEGRVPAPETAVTAA